MNIVIKRPAECSSEELRHFVDMVIEGGQVARTGLERRIRRAKFLAFAYENGELAAITAVKKASWFYTRDVFRKAGETNEAFDYRYELGWGYTRPAYRKRGLSNALCDSTLERSREVNLFGTTGTNNEAVARILSKRGFEKCGSPYPGRTESKQLWVRKVATRTDPGKWFLKNADFLLRGFERSKSYNNLLTTFRRKVKTRLTGAH